ncbi:unnamed protein product [Rotaria sp. Silwood1]|nr:unnamed protein product [Rotaria sp. Silwood1]CAF4621130.1 unnamed protein product [Rotaria sp. Silwood1]
MEKGEESLEDIVQKLHKQYKRICGVNYPHGYIPPYCRRPIWKQLVGIIAALQRSNIAHMDLKPQNILRVGNVLKACDLGISKYGAGFGSDEMSNFSAPEAMLLQGRYDPKVDIWSLGAILYYMTYGKQPNRDPGNRSWEPPYGHRVVADPLLHDVLVKTLQYKPHDRADLQTLQRHPYTRLP